MLKKNGKVLFYVTFKYLFQCHLYINWRVEYFTVATYIISPINSTQLSLNRTLNFIFEQIDHMLIVRQLFNNEIHVFVDLIISLLVLLTIIVKFQKTFFDQLGYCWLKINKFTLCNNLFSVFHYKLANKAHFLFLNFIVNFLFPSRKQWNRALTPLRIISLHVHEYYDSLCPIPSFIIKNLFFDLINNKLNKRNVLFVVDKSPFKYLDSLSVWHVEFLKLSDKFLLRLKIWNTSHCDRVILDMISQYLKCSEIQINTICKGQKLIRLITFYPTSFHYELI